MTFTQRSNNYNNNIWRLVLFLTLKIECWNYTVKSIVVDIFSFLTENHEDLKAIYYIEPTGKAVRKSKLNFELNWIESMSLSVQFTPERTYLITSKTRIDCKTLWSTFLPIIGLFLGSTAVQFTCGVQLDLFICFKLWCIDDNSFSTLR